MDFSASISNTISKWDENEDMSLCRATMEEGAGKLKDGIRPEMISNERIGKGDQILDTYSVVSDAIHGGMGSVWKVHHRYWNADLAMKRPQARFFAEGSERRKETFVAECEHWIDLGLHPNIVSCYYVREIGGIPTIFSEWMEKGSLEDRIKDGSVYAGSVKEAEERLIDIAIQFANGLHYAHEAGLLHQDVKPDNLLLTDEWEAKVADFGLAQARVRISDEKSPAGQKEGLLSTGYTPAYCSPEQQEGKTVNRTTDIYSWALSVLEMFLGERLWKKGAEARESIAGYTGEKRIPMPRMLEELLKQCTDPDPMKRPQDFAAIRERLLGIYKEETGRAYFRPEPERALATADSWNNRALSYLDLGKPETAEKCWEEALNRNGGHAESTYNRSLLNWRNRKIDDLDVLISMDKCKRDPNYDRLISKINLERGCPKEVTDNADPSDIQLKKDAPGSDSYGEATDGYVYQDILVAPDGSLILGVQRLYEQRMEKDNAEWNLDVFLPPGKLKYHIPCSYANGYRSLPAVDWFSKTACVLRLSRDGQYELLLMKLLENENRSIPIDEPLHPVFFSPDGCYLFTREKAVVDIRRGKIVKILEDIPKLPSPDGRIFAAQYDRPDNTMSSAAIIYDMKTMMPLKKMKGTGFSEGLYAGLESYKTVAAFSLDGKQLYLGNERFIRTLNTETGEIRTLVDDLDGFPFRIAVSPDAKMLAVTQRRGVQLLDAENGRRLWTTQGILPSAVAFTEDRLLISYSDKKDSDETYLETMKIPIFTYRADWALSRIRTTQQQIDNERRFVSGLDEAKRACEKGKYRDALNLLDDVRRMDGMTNDPRALELNRMIGRHGIRIELQSADFARELPFGCFRFAFSADGSKLLCHCGESARLVDMETGNTLRTFQSGQKSRSQYHTPSDPCHDFAIDAAGKQVVFAENYLYDADIGEIKGKLEGITDKFNAACFTPDGSRLAIASGCDEMLRIYRTADCSLEGELVIGPFKFCNMSMMPDGDTLLACAHEEREVDMISVSRKKVINLMNTPDFYARTVEGDDIQLPFGIGQIRTTREIPSNIAVHITRISVSPDGKTLLLEGDNFRCFTMDYDTHTCIKRADTFPIIRRGAWTGWESQVICVEGEVLALNYGSIVSSMWRIRDTEVSISPTIVTGPKTVLWRDRNGINDIAVSPNGRYAAVAPENGCVQIFDLNWKYNVETTGQKFINRLHRFIPGRKD